MGKAWNWDLGTESETCTVGRLRPVRYFPDMSGEPVARLFRERSDFFQTSIVERLVVIF